MVIRLTSDGLTISLFSKADPGVSMGDHLRTLDSASKASGQVAAHILAIIVASIRNLKAARYLVFVVLPEWLVSNHTSHCGLFIWRSLLFIRIFNFRENKKPSAPRN